MSKLKQVITVLLLLGTVTVYAVIFNRPCPTDVPVVQNFELERYLGRWYELQRYDQDFNLNYDCVQAVYGLIDPDTVSVQNSAFSLINETSTEALGTAKLSFPDQEIVQAKLNVSFFGKPNDQSNYWVIDTDYENFAIVWACEELTENESKESFGFLSRTRRFTNDVDANKRAFRAIRRYIDRSQIHFTNQLDERCDNF